MDKIRTLSAAIRYGSKLKPQVRNAVLCATDFGQSLGTCALGAAWDAVRTARGRSLSREDYRNYGTYEDIESIGVNLIQLVTHPINGSHSRLCEVIVSLNDNHLWTREAIADWLAEQGL